jgi:SpoVK/Ycf46/Vps4 family AAA+-type ATPase
MGLSIHMPQASTKAPFDFVTGKNAVLFLDELDAIAKMRDDRNELGELKRVVNTMIQGIDSLEPSAVVIAATNHAQMLDTAIWRRFPYKISFGSPERDLRQGLWFHFLGDDPAYEVASRMLALLSEGLSGADIQQFALAARRLAAHKDEHVDMWNLARLSLFAPESHRFLPFPDQTAVVSP